MKRGRSFPIRLISIVLAAFVIVFIGGYMGYNTVWKDYLNASTPAFTIPELSKGFIPQGIAYDPVSDCFFLTGYMGNRTNSPIYAIDGRSGALKKKVLMTDDQGESFRGHAGGLSVYGDRLYIAGSTDACMYYYPIAEMLNADQDALYAPIQRTDLKNDGDFIRVSFTSVDETLLYAGEFHRDPVFRTHASHRVEFDGVTQKAYLVGLSFDDDGQLVPVCVFSIPDNVQGASFADGYLYLSQARGFLPGQILTYRLDKIAPAGTKSVLGKDVPLYFVTEKTADKITKIFPQPEEIIVADGQMYILSESASNRYLIGKLLGLDKVYKTPVHFFQ